MMRHRFPYPDFPPLEIPDENLLGVFSPSIVKVEKTEEAIIEEALAHPIGDNSLHRTLTGREKVLLVVDDYTRSTPVQKILPLLLKELEGAGVKQERVRILIALGTHRPMSKAEMVGKFGQELYKQYPILNHEWWDASKLTHLGQTRKGTPIYVNRMVKEVDFIIGVGQIVPHRVSGFSGGGNITSQLRKNFIKREAGVLENLYSGTFKRLATPFSSKNPKTTLYDIVCSP